MEVVLITEFSVIASLLKLVCLALVDDPSI